MKDRTPLKEIENRMARFRRLMDTQHPQWQMAVIFSKINLLYFTGSMPEGMLVIERNDKATLWARRSYERTISESEFRDIKPMKSYRDAAQAYSHLPHDIYLETEFVPLAMFQRFQKHFAIERYQSLDFQIAQVRAVKSEWELGYMEQAGQIHQRVLEECVPEILHEGMTEADLSAELYQLMVKEGHQGATRFAMHDTEVAVAQLSFGDNSLFPTNFDGPGGQRGLNAAMPGLGSRDRKLKKGDLVFIDMGLGVNGYHSDKTMTYMYGQKLPNKVLEAHRQCVDIQNRVAEMLKPGAIAEEIYEKVMGELSEDFMQNFMGYGNRQVKFLAHGIGLTVDEFPVIAKGFKVQLESNMVFAVEPKKGIEGIGMVGIENTFVVRPEGGFCISGIHPGLMMVE